MKTYSRITMRPTQAVTTGLGILLMIIFIGCSDGSELSLSKKNGVSKKSASLTKNSNSNAESNMADYQISYVVDGLTWTYTITKKERAKGISHFIINLDNCGSSSSTMSNIVSATVNGVPANLENSEGNTGCDVASVTSNFVKFDDLPDASTYVITFTLNTLYGNFMSTTAWIKAGTSCHAYSITAPCCPL